MNLFEAINSRRLFRRKGNAIWFRFVQSGSSAYLEGVGPFPRPDQIGEIQWLVPSVVGGDDWEIQEPEVTVTQTQFWEAVLEAKNFYAPYSYQVLARKLGLED